MKLCKILRKKRGKNSNAYSLLYSKEYSDSSKRPYLNITYSYIPFKENIITNELFTNVMDESKVITLKHPYYACFYEDDASFVMCPYMALPNDGIHIEKGKNFFDLVRYWLH